VAVWGGGCDHDALLADPNAPHAVVNRHSAEAVALSQRVGELVHHPLRHALVRLVLEVQDRTAPRLDSGGADERCDCSGTVVRDLRDGRGQIERLLAEPDRSARHRRDQRDLVAVRQRSASLRVLLVDGVEQSERLFAELEGAPDVAGRRVVAELDAAPARARPLAQPGEEPYNDFHAVSLEAMATTEDRRETDSGIEIDPVYTPDDAPSEGREPPGVFPFTRGPYPDMYRGRPWTIRQYAGFASAEETNARFRYLLERGQTGLSVAFDLPTQLGYDSDDPRAAGEVGRTGVAVDSLADMELLFDGIPLGEVSTSMTINAPAALLLLLYELVAEGQGVPGDRLRGTVQNDVLKEYCARGNYIFPPRPSMRITTDLFAYCHERLPRWNTISISGYHIREAGATAVQELAFTIANGIAYCRAAVDAGLSPDEFGERLSFFFNAHNHFFQEVAKFRAARRLWAKTMRDRFGATNPKAQALRFHAQTGGSTLTAQQPENNIVRVAVQALSAVCGGAQSIHSNSFDEALALPTQHSARIALRTQQILAHEAGGTDTADPFGGSYFIEALTDELEQRATELIEHVEELGGAVEAIERGFVQREIEEAAFQYSSAVESGERVIVGVNRYEEEETEPIELHRIDPAAEKRQLDRTATVRAERDAGKVEAALTEVRRVALSDENLLPPMREALRVHCTVGEICEVLREEFGTYDTQRI
jgi:methylmalonyl-CoA mutase, N-terminal domain